MGCLKIVKTGCNILHNGEIELDAQMGVEPVIHKLFPLSAHSHFSIPLSLLPNGPGAVQVEIGAFYLCEIPITPIVVTQTPKNPKNWKKTHPLVML